MSSELPWAGVIEQATGDLLRCGFCDFAADGVFDPDREVVRQDVPRPGHRRGGGLSARMHRWDGSAGAWALVADPTVDQAARAALERLLGDRTNTENTEP